MAIPLPDGLVTPALVVDPDVLDRNISRMAEASRSQGSALRPHAKSHWCAQIADRQLRAGGRGLSVAAGECPARQCPAGRGARRPLPALERLPLHGRVPALRGSVVRARAHRATRPGHPELGTDLGELLRHILSPVAAVKNRSAQSAGATGRCGGPEGVGDQGRAHVVGDRPARQPFRAQVQHRGQIAELAAADGEMGYVAHVLRVGRLRGEVAPQQVRNRCRRRLGTVVRTFLRRCSPTMLNFRMTRSMRLWLTGSPASLSSAVTRGTP